MKSRNVFCFFMFFAVLAIFSYGGHIAFASLPEEPTLIAYTYEFYVDKNIGDDDNYNGLSATVQGSPFGPWETLTKAEAYILDPDNHIDDSVIINVAAGTYNECLTITKSGSSGIDQDIKWVANGGTVYIDGTDCGIYVNEADYNTFVGHFHVSSCSWVGICVNKGEHNSFTDFGICDCDDYAIYDFDGSYNTYDDCAMWLCDAAGFMTAYSDNITLTNSIVSNIGGNANGIQACGSSSYLVTYFTVMGCYVFDGDEGIYLDDYCWYCDITGNTIDESGDINNGILVETSCVYVEISNNTITDCDDTGIFIDEECLYITIAGNVIEGASTHTGIKITDENCVVTVEGNKVNVGGTYGIYVQDENIYCYFYSNMVWGALSSVVYDFDNEGGFKYIHNTFRNTATGGSYKAYYGRRLTSASNCIADFRNNIFYAASGSTYIIYIYGTGSYWKPTTCGYNCYWGFSNFGYYNGSISFGNWCTTMTETGTINEDPDFVPIDSCYIDVDSECNGGGIVCSVTEDVDGNPYYNGNAKDYDIGAHENTYCP